jgi:1-acyl-sn-glycerol-3-phosphate acyltransferase
LTEVLSWHASRTPEKAYLEFGSPEGLVQALTFEELLRGSTRLAAGLVERGLRKAEPVAIMLPTSLEFFFSFFGVLLAGGIPVPLYPPDRPGQLEDYLRRQSGILANCEARFLITTSSGKRLAPLLAPRVPRLAQLLTAEELSTRAGIFVLPDLRAEDIAFLQYTSGSTGDPKGVVLTHANLLANIRAMGSAIRATSSDVFVSWLPLYHDMGLIGAGLGTLYYGFFLALVSPISFLARPSRWLRMIHGYRGTLAAAPNFAYELCARRIPDSELAGLDLSSWRIAFNGSEPVSADTMRRFSDRFRRFGFRPGAFTPVYGLAESTVGLTFPAPGRGPRVERVNRGALVRDERAIPADASDRTAVELVGAGFPIEGHEVRIVDAQENTLTDRYVGRILFRGPSSTSGYFRNQDATRALFHPSKDPSSPTPWLDSGDYGFLANGELFIAGRAKDVIIRAGRHIFPQEVEDRVGEVPGVRKGCIAVFGSVDSVRGTEKIVIAAETRLTDEAEMASLRTEIGRLGDRLLEGAADEVVLLPPRSIPKTSSGKLRRSACLRLYERGELGRPLSRWKRWTHFGWPLLSARLNQLLRRATDGISGVYAWAVVLALTPVFAFGVAVIPGLANRLRFGTAVIRLALAVIGVKVRVSGEEILRSAGHPSVILPNHASYFDVPVLSTILPVPFHFVAKKEFVSSPVLGFFFRRLGDLFVERFKARDALEDVRAVERAVAGGQSVVIFPEGTFTGQAGLRPFRMGAFQVAARTGAPIIPVAIRGTRSILHADWWLPRRGLVEISVLPPISPKGDSWEEALRLRREARAAILFACGEPEVRE